MKQKSNPNGVCEGQIYPIWVMRFNR